MAIVSIPVLYDNNQKYVGGILMAIDSSSLPLGYKYFPPYPVIPGVVKQQDRVQTLEVKTTDLGSLFVPLTWDQYNALIQTGSLSNPIPLTFTYTIGTDINMTGDLLVTPDLANFTVLTISVGGVGIDIRTIPYSSSGSLDFTALGGVGIGTTVAITGYKI